MSLMVKVRTASVLLLGLMPLISCNQEDSNDREVIDDFMFTAEGSYSIESKPEDLFKEFLSSIDSQDSYSVLLDKVERSGFNLQELNAIETEMNSMFRVFNNQTPDVLWNVLSGAKGTGLLPSFPSETFLSEFLWDIKSSEVQFSVDHVVDRSVYGYPLSHKGNIRLLFQQLSAGGDYYGVRNLGFIVPDWRSSAANTFFKIDEFEFDFSGFITRARFKTATGAFGDIKVLAGDLLSQPALKFRYAYTIEQKKIVIQVSVIGTVEGLVGKFSENGMYKLELTNLSAAVTAEAYTKILSN